MKARKGEWFSLKWDIVDFYDPLSFTQYDDAPRFLYAEEDNAQIEGKIINTLDRIRLVSIVLTSVFITGEEGEKLPTHYRVGEFMPGSDVKYDKWLSEFHSMNRDFLKNLRKSEEVQQQRVFLEHTAKIIRHDMHSGINTYIPRGWKSLRKKLTDEVIEELNLGPSLDLLEEGIVWTQKVYKGVYAFTNLVREDGILETEKTCLSKLLREHIQGTAFSHQVEIEELPIASVNPVLFCSAIEFLIKGGLKFNNSEEKKVRIYMEDPRILCVEDNGVGLSLEDFLLYCKPYIRDGSALVQGLELNIAVAIILHHDFAIEPQKVDTGTIFRISLDKTFKQYLIDHKTMIGRFSVKRGN